MSCLSATLHLHHQLPYTFLLKNDPRGFPGGAVVKNLPASAGDTGLSPGPEKSHMPQSN